MSTTTTESPTIPFRSGAGAIAPAARVQAAFPAAVHLYNQVAAFADGDHGQALRDYWAAHDDLQSGNVVRLGRQWRMVTPQGHRPRGSR